MNQCQKDKCLKKTRHLILFTLNKKAFVFIMDITGVVADLWPNNSIIMRHFFKNNSRIMQTYNYLFVSIISFVNMNNMKITPNATMCSSIISLFLLITLFTVQL